MHGSVHKVEIAAVLPEVADQRPEPVGAVADKLGYQPKLKADYRNEVRADCDVDVVLPGAGSGALERIGVYRPFNGAELDVNAFDVESGEVLACAGDPRRRGQTREFGEGGGEGVHVASLRDQDVDYVWGGQGDTLTGDGGANQLKGLGGDGRDTLRAVDGVGKRDRVDGGSQVSSAKEDDGCEADSADDVVVNCARLSIA